MEFVYPVYCINVQSERIKALRMWLYGQGLKALDGTFDSVTKYPGGSGHVHWVLVIVQHSGGASPYKIQNLNY